MVQADDSGHCAGGGVEDAEGAVAVGHNEATQPGEHQRELPGVGQLLGPRGPVVGRDERELARGQGTSELCGESDLNRRKRARVNIMKTVPSH